MSLGFWKGRKVLVTGHTGFKGGWLCEWLLSLGSEPRGYALPPRTQPALFDQLRLAERMLCQFGDVRQLEQLRAFTRAADPEIVFHLAAQPLVRYSYEAPIETYSVNVLGTAHLLEACRNLPRLRAVVVIATDKCYENRDGQQAYRESDPLGGHDPYSSSKACAELVVDSYRRSFFSNAASASQVRVGSARAGNVIGGGDWAADRLIPDVIRAFLGGTQVLVRYPESVRPWQHVLEPLHGYLMLAEALWGMDGMAYAEAWNFGPDARDARTVREIMEQLCRIWPSAPGWRVDGGQHAHEARHLTLDSSKARARLGWSSAFSLEEALRATAEWYQVYASGGDAHSVTRRQIAHYTKLIYGG